MEETLHFQYWRKPDSTRSGRLDSICISTIVTGEIRGNLLNDVRGQVDHERVIPFHLGMEHSSDCRVALVLQESTRIAIRTTRAGRRPMFAPWRRFSGTDCHVAV